MFASFFKLYLNVISFKLLTETQRWKLLRINYKITPHVPSDSLNGIFH